MRIIHGIIFIRSGGDFTERRRIKQLPASERSIEKVTVSLAAIYASAAKS
jgi:hypothetical protein